MPPSSIIFDSCHKYGKEEAEESRQESGVRMQETTLKAVSCRRSARMQKGRTGWQGTECETMLLSNNK